MSIGVRVGSLSEAKVGPEKFYFDSLGSGRFLIQRCDTCGLAVFYPRSVCPHCGGESLGWFEPTGKGTVYATTTVHPAKDAGQSYNVCLVDLDEGVRLMSRVVDVPAASVRIGMRVTARVEGAGGDAKVVFESGRGD
ncbi:OB-fold domain-containing protein [Alcaligenaceae bacterium]|nr:OB-fold domain-containing protein [Alcaligenaceae bacterium]